MRRARRSLGVAVMLALAGASSAQAALSVSPSRVVLRAKPARVLVGFFVLENQGDRPLAVRVEPEDWAGGIGGARGPVGWLTVRPATLTLRPRKRARVKYTIRVPEDASGELRTQVFFTTELSGAPMPMRSRLGTIIYVGIEGTERIAAAITQVSASYTAGTPGVAQPDRLDVAVTIRNDGNAHIAPDGAVVIRDAEGRLVATVPLQSGWGLLPNEEDLYHAIGHGIHLTPGRHTLEVTVHCGGDLRHPITVSRSADAVVTETGTLDLLPTY